MAQPVAQTAYNADRGAPGVGVVSITPTDADLVRDIRSFYVGTGGNVSITAPDGTSAILKNIPAGLVVPVECRRINATSTSAADIVGFY